jgi:hypothetical protein
MDPATPKPGETGTAPAPSNEPGTASVPPVVNTSADVEQAKREAEQARIRANQLENENKKLKEAQEAARQKQLEEKEEFKTLYEQTATRLKEIEDRDAVNERAKELSTATEEVFKDYDPKAVELAKVAGLSLSDSTDEARTALKEKLDIFQKQVGPSASTPGSNNPHNPAPAAATREELVRRNGDGVSPMALAGAKGDDSVIKSYIRELPAVKRMREIAQNGA